MTLDYTNRKKEYLNVKLPDGKIVLLMPPKKALFTKLIEVEDVVNETEDNMELFDVITNLTAEILSTNVQKKKIAAKVVEELFDIEDMAYLIFEYAKFAGQVVKNPN